MGIVRQLISMQNSGESLGRLRMESSRDSILHSNRNPHLYYCPDNPVYPNNISVECQSREGTDYGSLEASQIDVGLNDFSRPESYI
jgi:hypothetical protein